MGRSEPERRSTTEEHPPEGAEQDDSPGPQDAPEYAKLEAALRRSLGLEFLRRVERGVTIRFGSSHPGSPSGRKSEAAPRLSI
jgi:hypothetical protein